LLGRVLPINELDIAVLLVAIFSITIYGIWRTRHHDDLHGYVRGRHDTPWWAIGLSVMATQASAVTFLSAPGQGYLDGLGFVQIYFGMPIALILISMFFIPAFHKLNIYTAYEFLHQRFDLKTRLLGAFLFLLQRGIGAGLTIYAPAIVLSTMFGWSLEATILVSGLIVTAYTVIGGTDAVTLTQKYQLAIIFLGMITAGIMLVNKLPAGMTFDDLLHVAGGFHRLQAVNFSFNPHERYTIWSGILGATFLMMSYFGTDQSQVQRYISGKSTRESRLALLFNAICKIPLQFFILFLGVLLFVFYQFQKPPLFFDTTANKYMRVMQGDPRLAAYVKTFDTKRDEVRDSLNKWLLAKHSGDVDGANALFAEAYNAQQESERIRVDARMEVEHKGRLKTSNADYVFITFILRELPHGVVGLLVAAFFLAALQAKSAELNALGTSSTVDFYKLLINKNADEQHALRATRWFTAFWGGVAVLIALFAHFAENLIQAVNILGSIFYGVMLALFVVAFGIRKVRGTAMFWSAIIAQTAVVAMYFTLSISYLWYPLIGCALCVMLSLLLETSLGRMGRTA
jgi:Na+/proline symporter